MKQQTLRKLLIPLLIVVLAGLLCHGHYRTEWYDEDGHCVVCQLLISGFTGSLSFTLVVFLIRLLTFRIAVGPIRRLTFYFGKPFRGPPLNPLCTINN